LEHSYSYSYEIDITQFLRILQKAAIFRKILEKEYEMKRETEKHQNFHTESSSFSESESRTKRLNTGAPNQAREDSVTVHDETAMKEDDVEGDVFLEGRHSDMKRLYRRFHHIVMQQFGLAAEFISPPPSLPSSLPLSQFSSSSLLSSTVPSSSSQSQVSRC
jgi:hypothetical protein